MTCKKTLTINFPGYFYGFHKVEQNCTQPSCKVLKFVRENREWCEGKIVFIFTTFVMKYVQLFISF